MRLNSFFYAVLFIAVFGICPVWGDAVPTPSASVVEDYDAIYQKLFGRPFVKLLQTYTVTVVVNQRALGEMSLLAPPTGPVSDVNAEDFAAVLKPFLQHSAYEALFEMADLKGKISEKKLSEAGYSLAFSRSRRRLVVTVPKAFRNPVVYVDLQSGQLQPEAAPQQGVSGYVNLLGRVTQSEDAFHYKASPVSIDTLSVLNMGGVVFKTQGNFDAQDSVPYAVQSLQLLTDDQTNWTRYVAGDTDFPVRGFQGYTRSFGVGVGRMYYLNPILAERGYQSMTREIEDDGVLTFSINETVVWSQFVEKGTYVFENMPIKLGINRILFVLKKSDGTETRYSDIRIRDPRLVGVGDHEFYYHAGFLNRDLDRVYQIEGENPVFSGYHMVGLAPFWLQAGYFQKDKDRQLLGGESYFPTEFGLFRLHASHYSETSDSGKSMEISQSSYYEATGWLRYHELSYLKKDAFFRRFGATPDDVSQRLSLNTQIYLGFFQFGLSAFAQDYLTRSGRAYGASFGIGQTWPWFSSSLSGSYAMDGDGNRDYTATALFYADITKDWRSELFLQGRKQAGDVFDVVASYRLTWALGGGDQLQFSERNYLDQERQQELAYRRQFGDISTDTSLRFSQNGLRDAEVYLSGYDPYNAFSLQSSLSERDGSHQGYHFFRYRNTRGGTGVTYAHTNSASGVQSYTAAYSLETAIAFADGQVAVGRPIRDNFVLVYPEDLISGQSFRVGQNSVVDMFGPALVTDLPPLYQSRIDVGQIAELPEGYDLGPTHYRVTPGYYTGRAIRVGNGLRKKVFGIVQVNGQPMRYVVTDVFREEKPDEVIMTVLTGSNGQFMIQGLSPGKYGIRFQAMTDDEIHFELDSDKETITYDFGVLAMPPHVIVD